MSQSIDRTGTAGASSALEIPRHRLPSSSAPGTRSTAMDPGQKIQELLKRITEQMNAAQNGNGSGAA